MLKSSKYYQNTIQLKLTAAFCKIKYDWVGIPHALRIDFQPTTLPPPKLFPSHYLSYGFFFGTIQQERIMQKNNSGVFIAPDYGTHKGVECPIYPAHFALLASDQLLNFGIKPALKTNLIQAHLDHLLNVSLQTHFGISLPNNYDLDDYECKSGWVNGLAQSLASSAFLRGGFIFDDKDLYFDKAKSLLRQMLAPKESGGSAILINNNQVWIEEYPGKSPSMVLNGFIGALVGLLDYRNVTGDLSFDNDIHALISTLQTELPSFIFGKYVRYCKKHFRFSNLMYQGLYVFQMIHLFELTKNESFLQLAHRFNTVDWKEFCRFYEIDSPEHIQSILQQYL